MNCVVQHQIIAIVSSVIQMGGLFSGRSRPARLSTAFVEDSAARNTYYEQAPDGSYFGINEPTVCSRVGGAFQVVAPTRFDATQTAPRNDSSFVLVVVIYSLMNGVTLQQMPQLYYEAGIVVAVAVVRAFSIALLLQAFRTMHAAVHTVYQSWPKVSLRSQTFLIGAINYFTCSLIVKIGGHSSVRDASCLGLSMQLYWS